MKKTILLLSVMLAVISTAHAQRKSNGFAIKASAGLMKGVADEVILLKDFGTTFSAGVSHNIRSSSYIIDADVIYQNFSTDYHGQTLPNRFYGLKLQAGYSIEEVMYPLIVNFKLGGFVGHEQVNNGIGEEKHGLPLPYPTSSMVYGAVLTPELEVVLYRKLCLLINASQYWNVGSKYAEWMYSFNAGLKVYL